MGRRTNKQIEADNLAAAAPVTGLPTSGLQEDAAGIKPSVIPQLVVANEDTIINAYIDHNMLVVAADTKTLYHLDVAEPAQTICGVLKNQSQLIEMI